MCMHINWKSKPILLLNPFAWSFCMLAMFRLCYIQNLLMYSNYYQAGAFSFRNQFIFNLANVLYGLALSQYKFNIKFQRPAPKSTTVKTHLDKKHLTSATSLIQLILIGHILIFIICIQTIASTPNNNVYQLANPFCYFLI